MKTTLRFANLGVALLVLSAVTFSSAGIFTKAVAADAWSVIFWRGLSGALFSLLFLALRGKIRDELARFAFPAVLATLIGASGTAAFLPAFKLTSVANVSLIWATAPLLAALLAWIAIRERPSKRVMLCSVLALLGVAITVSGSQGSANLLGDALAFWMTLMMAGMMVLYRVWPDTPTVLPAALSSFVLLGPALWISDPLAVSGFEIGVLIVFGLIFAIASITLAEGARRVPSAQAALISLLETPLAPFWALLILAEAPSVQAIAGGAIIMTAILTSQSKARKAQKA